MPVCQFILMKKRGPEPMRRRSAHQEDWKGFAWKTLKILLAVQHPSTKINVTMLDWGAFWTSLTFWHRGISNKLRSFRHLRYAPTPSVNEPEAPVCPKTDTPYIARLAIYKLSKFLLNFSRSERVERRCGVNSTLVGFALDTSFIVGRNYPIPNTRGLISLQGHG